MQPVVDPTNTALAQTDCHCPSLVTEEKSAIDLLLSMLTGYQIVRLISELEL